jgi:hypothetical protein
MEYTKGPWKLYEVGDRIKRLVPTKDSISLLTIVEENGKYFAAVDLDVNARLIAAAPELLEACKEFVRKVECGQARSKRSYAQMKYAIKKAED